MTGEARHDTDGSLNVGAVRCERVVVALARKMPPTAAELTERQQTAWVEVPSAMAPLSHTRPGHHSLSRHTSYRPCRRSASSAQRTAPSSLPTLPPCSRAPWHAWRLVGAVDRTPPISRGRSMVRRSVAPLIRPPSRPLSDGEAPPPRIPARLPAVGRAWEQQWRVPCSRRAARYQECPPLPFWGERRHLRYSQTSHLGAGIELNFNASSNQGQQSAHPQHLSTSPDSDQSVCTPEWWSRHAQS